MRKIKFRGRDFYTGEWCYGGCVQIPTTGEVYIVNDSDGSSVNYRHFRRVKPETVQQLVDVDKNGVEVYEGDKVALEGDKKEGVAILKPTAQYPFGKDWSSCLEFEPQSFEKVTSNDDINDGQVIKVAQS